MNASQDQEVINIALPRDKWVAILQTIAMRQKECRQVTSEFRGHETFTALDVEYEKLKMQIAKQLPAAR